MLFCKLISAALALLSSLDTVSSIASIILAKVFSNVSGSSILFKKATISLNLSITPLLSASINHSRFLIVLLIDSSAPIALVISFRMSVFNYSMLSACSLRVALVVSLKGTYTSSRNLPKYYLNAS